MDSWTGSVATVGVHTLTVVELIHHTPAAALDARSPSGAWSARENLAHLGRYQEIFLDRLDRILAESTPRFDRYRTADDPAAEAWLACPGARLTERLLEGRAGLVSRLQALRPRDLARRGVHPAFGVMDVPGWLRFFLEHEGHHLYVARLRAAQGGN